MKTFLWSGLSILLILLLLPLPLSPTHNQFEQPVTFLWSGYAHTLIIDDNQRFSSPETIAVSGQSHSLTLKPATYYWKVQGLLPSTARHFTLDSIVAIERSNQDTTFKNKGTVAALLSFFTNTTSPTAAVILDPQEAIQTQQQYAYVEVSQHD